jgi:hypothetical protein
MTTNAKRETRLIRIPAVPLAHLKPAKVNDQMYRPVDTEEPGFLALLDSVRSRGVLVPLTVTLDWVVLSGHRRYAAARAAGLLTVPCQVHDVWSTDPDFLPLLVAYNLQRVKSRDEVLREEVVSAGPEEAYAALVEHRKARARVSADTITIEGFKTRARISAAKLPMLDACRAILEEYRAYWPLTDRRIHYYLQNDPPLRHASKPGSVYRNDKQSYKDVCDLLTRARLTGDIPFDAIDDPTRPVVTWDVHRDVGSFIRRELDGFLKGYWRDLQQ